MAGSYNIEDITFNIYLEGSSIRVKSPEKNIILRNQNIETVAKLIDTNFKIVSGYYREMIKDNARKFELPDLNRMCFAIVTYYLYMYNMWRNTYKK